MPRLRDAQFRHCGCYLTKVFVRWGRADDQEAVALFDQDWEQISRAQRWAAVQSLHDNPSAVICLLFPNLAGDLLERRRGTQARAQWWANAVSADEHLTHSLTEAVHDVKVIGDFVEPTVDLANEIHASLSGIDPKLRELATNYALAKVRILSPLFDRLADTEGSSVTPEIKMLCSMSSALLDSGEAEQAQAAARRALEASLGRVSQEALISSLNALGMAYSGLGQLALAHDYYQQALTRAQTVGSEQQVVLLNNIASIYMRRGNLAGADKCLQQALKQVGARNDSRGEALIHFNFGSLASENNQGQAAQKHYRRSLELTRALGDRHREAFLLGSMGLAAMKLRRYAEAHDYLQQARALFNDLDMGPLVAQTERNLVVLQAAECIGESEKLEAKGDRIGAEAKRQQAKELAAGMGETALAALTDRLQQQLGSEAIPETPRTRSKRLPKAWAASARRLDSARRPMGLEQRWLAFESALTADLLRQGQFREALGRYASGMQQSQLLAEMGMAHILLPELRGMGIMLTEIGELDDAHDSLSKASQIAWRMGDPRAQMIAESDVATLHIERMAYAEALGYLEAARQFATLMQDVESISHIDRRLEDVRLRLLLEQTISIKPTATVRATPHNRPTQSIHAASAPIWPQRDDRPHRSLTTREPLQPYKLITLALIIAAALTIYLVMLSMVGRP